MDHLDLRPGSLLFIENVGNLVCPAAFDLGEDAKVAILSVTEGEDKPLKYPDMFTAASLAILNKIDLAPHCDADLDAYEANLRRVNPMIDDPARLGPHGRGDGGLAALVAPPARDQDADDGKLTARERTQPHVPWHPRPDHRHHRRRPP